MCYAGEGFRVYLLTGAVMQGDVIFYKDPRTLCFFSIKTLNRENDEIEKIKSRDS